MKKERKHRRARMAGVDSGVAFSTGQAARYCFVTADTILNWIKSGSLTAQRTVGGQYRIRSQDLLTFMREHMMSTELLESELGVRPHCWEFHCRGQTEERCLACIAYRSGAMNCFELSTVLPDESRLNASCAGSDYYRRYSGEDQDEE
ncbi:MAG: excisionase family DNA-binding protein [Deltaproteobacteria bacterium]|nr:excisionase family DNA-binding protein [Deltaproteobacteria bacterium]